MQGVILAAGLNERLWSIGVGVGEKPLPLVQQHVEDLLDSNADRVVVVASPQNVERIVELVAPYEKARIVIQPFAAGPGDALRRGLEAVDTNNIVWFVCGDNIIPPDAWDTFRRSLGAMSSWHDVCFGAASISLDTKASRFARYAGGVLHEGEIRTHSAADGHVVWLGPVKLPGNAPLHRILERQAKVYTNLPIVPALNELCETRSSYSLQPLHLPGVKDIGTPEEWVKIAPPDPQCTGPGYAHAPHGLCSGYGVDRT